MRQFLVPQFIDVEDKIIGPVTTRQFALVLIACLLLFVFYKMFPFVYFIFIAIFDLGIFSILAFAKINGRPIHFFILNMLQTLKKPNLRVWNKEAFLRDVTLVSSKIQETKIKDISKESITGSRLSDLTLIVNTGGVYENDDIIDNSIM